MKNKIVPHLWFDTDAIHGIQFYTSLFRDSAITYQDILRDTPSGDCDIVMFHIGEQEFEAINGGPFFTHNPTQSLMVNFDPGRHADAKAYLDHVWEGLIEGGHIRIPLGSYPFSKHYGWVKDRFGIEWQLILTNEEGDERPFIMPCLSFSGERYKQAEAAGAFYVETFESGRRGTLYLYEDGQELQEEGAVMFSDIHIEDCWMVLMDGPMPPEAVFNESMSYIIYCENQEEIDGYWEKLSAVKEAEQCGWIKDKFGISWQITPIAYRDWMLTKDDGAKDRMMQAILNMKKLDIQTIEAAMNEEG